MRKFIFLLMTSIVINIHFLDVHASEVLIQTDQWKHKNALIPALVDGKADFKGRIVLYYGSSTTFEISLLSKEKFIPFIKLGQGPSELVLCYNFFNYGNDFAFTENPDKVKIFTQKNDTYVMKESKWFKRGSGSQLPLYGLLF